ncbi:MAG TPA: hypothetical protein VH085_06835 [Nocardioides sp.]|jgi:hypothetical protein|nr:hypothetical protein [Nocardioides sp.]
MSARRLVNRRLRLVAALIATILASSWVAVSPGSASTLGHHHGAPHGTPHSTAHVTFTKWIVTQPANPPSLAGVLMRGVVGGAVGNGTYVGTVLNDDLSDPGFWHADALYGFFGHRHSFIARLRITENDTVDPATAVLRGVVIAGWRHDQRVHGVYTTMDPCPMPTPGNVLGRVCFQGSLAISAP